MNQSTENPESKALTVALLDRKKVFSCLHTDIVSKNECANRTGKEEEEEETMTVFAVKVIINNA